MKVTKNSNIDTMPFAIGKCRLKNIVVTSLSISLKVCSYEKLLLSDIQDNINGCHRLAEFREIIKLDVAAGLPLYKENCDSNKYPKSCYKYGQHLLTGKGMPDSKPDVASALTYYDKSCDLNYAGGCFVAAELRMTPTIGCEQSTEKALALYSKACDLKDAASCFKLSNFYLVGQHVGKNLSRAYELAKVGCELDNMMACNNLSIMYRHGHGTEKNSHLADQAKKKAVQLNVSESKKQPDLKVNQ